MKTSDITCCACGIVFSVPYYWEQCRREKHDGFYCPNGHSLSFPTESDAERFRRERNMAIQEKARLEDEVKRLQAENNEAWGTAAIAEQKLKRHHKRASAGLCPHCNRTFYNMARHIKTKHANAG